MKYTRYLFAALILFSFSLGSTANPDIELIRSRVLDELLRPDINPDRVNTLITTLNEDGSWPGIDYEDLRSISYQNKIHVTNIRYLSVACKKPGSPFYEDARLKKVLSRAIDFWIEHDFICDNWHTNEISNPSDWAAVLMLIDADLTREQVAALSDFAGRANLHAWGARPGGDLIKIAGIMAEKAIWERSERALQVAVDAMAGQIRISSGLGIKPDLGFHHRVDRVTSILSYGTGYASTFADWTARLAGTRYNFPEPAMKLLIDYYLDGICKSMVHAWYKDPGVMNRGMARRGALSPADADIPGKLMLGTDYRKAELENIARIRKGEQKSNLKGNRFFTHSEYFSHQRPGYFASVRMFSTRNHNMEYPHNQESLKQHHHADGSNFLSRTGREYYDIQPVLDWQKIPGTTVVQKPALPHWSQIVKKGLTGFVGAVSDGLYGAAAFDFVSPHDTLKARKAWFFFDDEYVCLGAHIVAESIYPVNTTLSQSLLKGDVVVKTRGGRKTLQKSSHQLNGAEWIFHDSVAYVFRQPVDVHLDNKTYTGYWQGLVSSAWARNEPEVSKEVFALWLDHGKKPRGAQYEYMVVPGVDLKSFNPETAGKRVKTLANTGRLQGVYHPGLGMTQAVFYEPGSVELPAGAVITAKNPGMVILQGDGKNIQKITVADPDRSLKQFILHVNQRFEGAGENWKAYWNETERRSEIEIDLPQGAHAGESVVMGSRLAKSVVTRSTSTVVPIPATEKKPGERFVGEKFGGGTIIWVDETGSHGLVAADSDQHSGISWKNGPARVTQHFGDRYDRVTFARGDGIGAGQMNTMLIIAQQAEDDFTGNFAARVCSEYQSGDYGDWYLPSKTELKILFEQKDLLGEFNSDFYWSSTEYNVGFVWLQGVVGYGGEYTQTKGSQGAVRCIRKF